MYTNVLLHISCSKLILYQCTLCTGNIIIIWIQHFQYFEPLCSLGWRPLFTVPSKLWNIYVSLMHWSAESLKKVYNPSTWRLTDRASRCYFTTQIPWLVHWYVFTRREDEYFAYLFKNISGVHQLVLFNISTLEEFTKSIFLTHSFLKIWKYSMSLLKPVKITFKYE